MKRILNIVLISLLLQCVLTSCNDNSESYFDKPPSERIAEKLTSYHELLKNSDYGWKMLYFPGGSNQKFGGFCYVLKFTEDKVVASLFGNERDKNTESYYSLNENGGGTLSFDTFNVILHLYAHPKKLRPQGAEGDFEFLLVSKTEDEIVLKGKKYKTKIVLKKLKKEGDKYFEGLQKIYDVVTGKGFTELLINDKPVEFDFPRDGKVVTFIDTKSDSEKKGTFIYTEKGIRFYKPIEVAGVEFQDLFLNSDASKMQNADKNVVFRIPYPVPFDVENLIWETKANDPKQCSKSFTDEWKKTKEFLNTKMKGDLKPEITLGKTAWSFSSSGNTYYDKGITFIAQNRLYRDEFYTTSKNLLFQGTLIKGEVDLKVGAAWAYWNLFRHMDSYVETIVSKAPYMTEKDNDKDPKTIKLISTKDPNFWFIVTKKTN